ncbi:MAG: cyclophilin-like fold protein [Alphaproteobacteria bacterium]|nr:cyclophilin-like fold protein [Alphaproteobacteria bacterium]
MIKKKIKIEFSSNFITVELDNTNTAKEIWDACPIASVTNTWGKEIYFETGIKVVKEKSAKDIINLGEIAFWVEGSSIAIGFGATPISKVNEIRLVTKANIIGKTKSDLSILEVVNSGEIVIVERIY